MARFFSTSLCLVALLMVACGSEAEISEAEANQTAGEEEEGKDSTFGQEALAAARAAAKEGNGASSTASAGDRASPPPGTGDRANWTSCEIDAECQSGWCGCAFAETKSCLPSKTFPKTCKSLDDDVLVKGAANWSSCSKGDECRSGVCGCYGSAEKQCLPDATWSKTCAADGSSAGRDCKADSECASGVCGCYGGTRRQCLPDASFRMACEPAPQGSACKAPWGTCDGTCTNLQLDPNNCGSCGNKCFFLTPFCKNGSCHF